jgi:type II secretory pathway pseudopilin PulG
VSYVDVVVICAFVTVAADVVAIVSITLGSRAIRAGAAQNRQERRELLEAATRCIELTNELITRHDPPLVPPGHPDARWRPPDPDDPWGRRE